MAHQSDPNKPPAYNPGIAPPQQAGYPHPQQDYPPPQQGYPHPQQGYPHPQQGYPHPQQGYPQPQQGNPSPQQGYPHPQQGYPQPQQGPPPQQGYPQPQQGYPQPQQGYPQPQQGNPPPQQSNPPPRPNQPPTAYPPPQSQPAPKKQTVVYQSSTTGSLESTLGSLFKSAEKVVGSAANSVTRGVDRYANSPLLRLFSNGNVLTLQSRESARCLQVLPNGAVDGNGNPTQLTAQFVVISLGHNIVILRSVAYTTCHIGNHGGNIIGNGNGDHSCQFRLHETMQGFITFESVNPVNNYIGVTSQGNIKPAGLVRKDASAMFVPSLVSSPYTTATAQKTAYQK